MSTLRTLIPDRLPALTHRNFRLLWFGQMVSVAGSQMQWAAISWQIYQQTDSAVMLGLIGLVRVVPVVVFSLLGGMVADSRDRRRVMLVTQSSMLVASGVLALVTSLDLDTAAIVLGLTALSAAATAFDNPARQSLIPNLVPPEHLTNAVSLNTMMFQSARIIGPALSGLIIAGFGVAAVYWINSVTFVATIAAVLLLHDLPTHQGERPRVGLDSLFEGLRFVRDSRLIFSTMLLDFFATFFASATTLLPIFARDILRVGPQGFGLLYSAEAIGSLVAGLAMSLIVDVRHKGRLLLWSVGLYGVATILFGVSSSYALSLIMLAAVGAGDSVSTVLRQTIRQLVTPDYIRGRMNSVNMVFFMGGPQLGNLEAGIVASLFGAPLAVVTGGVATILVVGWTAWRYPRLRRYGSGGVGEQVGALR